MAFQLVTAWPVWSLEVFSGKPLHFLSIFQDKTSSDQTGQAVTSWKAIFGGSIEPMSTTIQQSPSLRESRPKESALKTSKIQKYVEITSIL